MESVRFGELYSIPSGNGLSRPSAVRGNGYRMIGMGELFAKDIISDMEMDRVQMSEREKKTFLVQADDLLFARQSLVAAGAGKCSVVKELSEPTTYESHLIRVRLDKNRCNPWYYYYLFKLPENPIKAIVNQCAQAGIRGNELAKIKVPLPERRIQERIVSILSTYDNLIEVNNKRIKVLEQMAENLYKEWFVRFRFPGHENAEFENGIPKGWDRQRLENFGISLDSGSRPSGGIDNSLIEGMPSLGAESVNGLGEFDYNNVKLIPVDYYQKMKHGKNTGRDILIYKDGAYIGKTTIFMNDFPYKKFAVNEHVFLLNAINEKYQLYLYFTLHSPEYYALMQNLNRNAAQPGLSKLDMNRIKIIVPNQGIIQEFNSHIEPLLKTVFTLALQKEVLSRQRDLLLPRLISGKLEV